MGFGISEPHLNLLAVGVSCLRFRTVDRRRSILGDEIHEACDTDVILRGDDK